MELILCETRRRMTLIFRLNVSLSIAVATFLIISIVTAVVLGLTGHELPATVLGAAGLLPAAVCRPLTQINRAFVLAKRTEWFMLSACDRLRATEGVKPKKAQAAALAKAWGDILADLKALTEEYSSAEAGLTGSMTRFLNRH